MSQGYFRYPAVCGDQVTFISEDDLWTVPLTGGTARRLTSGLGSFSRPAYSPDGKWLAFSSQEEGHLEVYVMPAQGGELKRLTYLGAQSLVTSWKDNETIFFASDAFEAQRVPTICEISLSGGMPRSLQFGPAINISIAETGAVVLERNSFRADPAHWKRYRGGTAGKLWIAPHLAGEFKALISLNSNLSRPLWIQDRVYFVSDHEGVGNIYSCDSSGKSLLKHTRHQDFYVRNPSTDGRKIVYHAGADIFSLNPHDGKVERIEVEYKSQRTFRQRKFVSASEHLEMANLDSKGKNIVVTTRGQAFAMGNWDGPVINILGEAARYRLAEYLNDDVSVATVTDKGGEEQLEIFNTETKSYRNIADASWGRFTSMSAAPKGDYLAFANHRNELWVVDVKKETSRKIVRNEHSAMRDYAWSPDGRWLAFAHSETWNRSRICVADMESGEVRAVTKPLLEDFFPNFDPEGKFLYFLSKRELNPVYDNMQFELSFPRGEVPCLITLKKETPSPFLIPPTDEDDDVLDKQDKEEKDDSKNKKDAKKSKDIKVEIDFDGIEERVLAFPVDEGCYTRIIGLKKKVMFLSHQPAGALYDNWMASGNPAVSDLEMYDFTKKKCELVTEEISDVAVSADRSHMLLRIGNRLRVLKAGEKPGKSHEYNADGGFINLGRIRTLIDPASEWKQMMHEVWRLQRDHFWREDMSKINWIAVLKRYVPLVARVNTRSEFGDLVWEMQGELGTSHAYDMGGDYRLTPQYPIGLLGANFSWDASLEGYRIDKIIRGDCWKISEASPLRSPGVLLEVGDAITRINGRELTEAFTPHHALLHQAKQEVELGVRRKNGKTEFVRVRTLGDERNARYREWVDQNRDYVARKTNGRIGYVHIPDMSARGFSEFHRHFLRDFDCDGLIIDVRYNGGGHVSQLLLEKLCRKRIGADETRWFGVMPVPGESPAGPMVALTNEYAGSDGDIFSHTFKIKKAGPLIGRRTWGGVIGIWPRHRLVDGGVTTQPEFSHWFEDVGWKVENYGTDPDIDVDIAPHHYRVGTDPQLDRGIEEVKKLLMTHPPFRPILDNYPDLSFDI